VFGNENCAGVHEKKVDDKGDALKCKCSNAVTVHLFYVSEI